MRAVGPTSAIRLSLFFTYGKISSPYSFALLPPPPPLADKATPFHSIPEEFIAFHFQFSSLTIRLSFFSRPPPSLSPAK